MENLKYNKKSSRVRFGLCFHKSAILLLFCILFSSCSVNRGIRLRNKSLKAWMAYEWEEVKKSSENNVNDWTISTRKIKDSNFFEYKIEGEVKSSPKTCISSFRQDIHTQATALKNKKFPLYEIVEQSRASMLTYVIHNEPFPFKNTEMSVRYHFFDREDHSSGISWSEAWDESSIPNSKKLNRVEIFRGSWSFFPSKKNMYRAVKSVSFDPKKMPMWLVKPMVFKFLKDGLQSMREMISTSAEEK